MLADKEGPQQGDPGSCLGYTSILIDLLFKDTTVSIVGYQIVKTKEKGFSETNPQAQILGIGFDRTLGGSEITFRYKLYFLDLLVLVLLPTSGFALTGYFMREGGFFPPIA